MAYHHRNPPCGWSCKAPSRWCTFNPLYLAMQSPLIPRRSYLPLCLVIEPPWSRGGSLFLPLVMLHPLFSRMLSPPFNVGHAKPPDLEDALFLKNWSCSAPWVSRVLSLSPCIGHARPLDLEDALLRVIDHAKPTDRGYSLSDTCALISRMFFCPNG